MEIGFAGLPRRLETIVEIGQRAEAAGVRWLGVADSPVLFTDPHAAIQAILGATSTMRVGTCVTNPVTRHWSVQASAFRALDQLGPGRSFMGIGPGDSAVHSVGLAPASPTELASYVEEVRRLQEPGTLDVMVAAGGPKTVRHAAAYADHLILGQGASREAIDSLGQSADSAERKDGGAPQRWLFLIFNLADHARDYDSARADIRAIVVAFSRQAFDRTFEGKSVRPELQEPLRALYANYAFEQHSLPGESANARLLAEEERAELEAFLFERFALVDVPEAAAERLLAMTEHTGIDRVFLCIEASDPLKLVRLACERMLPRLPL